MNRECLDSLCLPASFLKSCTVSFSCLFGYLNQVRGDFNRALEELKHMSVGLLINFIIESPLVLRQGLFTLTLQILVPNIGVCVPS